MPTEARTVPLDLAQKFLAVSWGLGFRGLGFRGLGFRGLGLLCFLALNQFARLFFCKAKGQMISVSGSPDFGLRAQGFRALECRALGFSGFRV